MKICTGFARMLGKDSPDQDLLPWAQRAEAASLSTFLAGKRVVKSSSFGRNLWLVAPLASAALFAAPAAAADKIYWSNFDGTFRVGNLDGSGAPETIFKESQASADWPAGGEAIVINPATGKIYWTLWSKSQIRVWNLDGSGTPETLFQEPGFTPPKGSGPVGMAIDPAAGKLYWTNWGWNYPSPNGEWGQVRVGNLDGSGAPKTLYEGEWAGGGLGLDPAAGKLYWTRGGRLHEDKTLDPGAIRVGKIDGSASAQDLYANEDAPNAMAIDPTTNKVYWANYGRPGRPGAIRVANLDGSGTPKTLYASEGHAMNVAIDPDAGKIYWTDAVAGAIRVGNLDGSGKAQNLGPNYTSEGTGLHWLALLRAPLAKGAPAISGRARVGSTLTCSQGGWAGDLVGGFLYRAPRSFSYQWLRAGKIIESATRSNYTPTHPGSYSCQVTASNHAGSSAQTSRETNVN